MAAKRKTIALVAPDLRNTGGVATVTKFVMRTLLERSDFDVKLISLATAARDRDSVRLASPRSWFTGITTSGGEFAGVPYQHIGASLAEIETRRFLPRPALAGAIAGADLVQVVCGSASWGNAVLGLGIPVCIQTATLIAVEREARDARLTGLAGRWKRHMTQKVTELEGPALRGATCVQVENAWMFDHVTHVTQGADTHVTYGYPGVDTSHFRPLADRPDAPGYVLAVGRMQDPRKNHMLLLEAYARLHKTSDNPPRLVLAGAQPPSDAFMAAAKGRGLEAWIDVHVKPDHIRLGEIYRGARAFVLTSEEEGFGMTVVEAMASGVPVVSTLCGGPDEIISDGVDGFLVRRGDAETLAERLKRLVQDDDMNKAMGAAARHKVDLRYSEQVAGQAFLDVYSGLLT